MKKLIVSIFFLFSLLLLSGCFQIDVSQTLHRNGDLDMTLLFAGLPDMLSDSVLEALKVNPIHEPNLVIEELDSGLQYTFTGVDVSKGPLFLDSEALDDMNSAIFSIDSYVLTREFKFPFYYYTYTIDLTDADMEELDLLDSDTDTENGLFDESMLGSMTDIKVRYTIDVFGKITQTSGSRMSDTRVRYRPDVLGDEVFYVTFRDFFLWSWFGGLF